LYVPAGLAWIARSKLAAGGLPETSSAASTGSMPARGAHWFANAGLRCPGAEEDLEHTKEEVGVRIATIYNKLETTRAMVEVAREHLAARQENARLSDEQCKRGVLLTSQRDASHAQAMKAQAGFLEASLDYLLTRDELTRTLGRTAP
jgi:hypothetical protein